MPPAASGSPPSTPTASPCHRQTARSRRRSAGTAGKLLQAVNRPMAALADAVGVAVGKSDCHPTPDRCGARLSGSAFHGAERARCPPPDGAAGRRRGAQPPAAVPAAGAPLELAQRRPVCARQRHGGGNRQAARRLDPAERSLKTVSGKGWAPRERIQVAPGLAMRPTRQARADGTGLRHRSFPGLVRQTVVGRKFRQAPECSLTRDGDDHDVGTTTHPEADVVVAVVRSVVVAIRRATVPRVVVPRPAAQHAGHVSGCPTGRSLLTEYASRCCRRQKNSRAPLRGAQ